MNNAVVIFLDSVDNVYQVVESGVVIKDTLIPLLSLLNPVRKVTISNVPPFVRNKLLEKLSAPIFHKNVPFRLQIPTLKTCSIVEKATSNDSQGEYRDLKPGFQL